MKHLNHFTAQCAAFTRLVYLTCLLSFVLCPSSLSAQIPSYVPTTGLVGWWPFNGNANDESGNGNNGTVNGATLTTDRFGVANKAYSFDGVNDFGTLGITLPNTFTVSFWFNITAFSTYVVAGNNLIGSELVSTLNNNFSNTGFANGLSGAPTNYGAHVSSFWCNSGCNNVGATSNATLNQWVYVTTTYSGSSLKYYVNGALNGTVTSNFVNNSVLVAIGARPFHASGPDFFFNGKLDDIAIYNRVLTQQEISNLYVTSSPPIITTSASPSLINCGESATLSASSTSATQPCVKAELPATLQNGLVGYWPFCGNANDASGNNNNGTVNGATLTTDRFGNASSAYNFNGGQNRIVVSNSILPNTPSSFTISLWVLSNTTGISAGELICDRSQSNYDYKYRLHIRGDLPDSPVSFASVSNLNFTGTYGGSFIIPAWKHIVAVGNSSNNTTVIYIDGQLVGNCGFYYPLNFNSTTFGANFAPGSPGYDSSFNGKIDDIAIYNRALTATEVQQLYNLGNVTYSWSTGATTPSITVTPAQTTSYTCTATNSSGSTTSSVSVTVADTLTWTGYFDTDWHKPCNWSPQFVPKCCNNVAVPLTTNQPIVSGVAAAEDLTIYTTNGAQVTVNNGANLQIADCPTTITTSACPSLAVITTTAISSITQTAAVSGGIISYQGASAITARGICWGTSPNPTIANSLTSNGTGIGTFTSNLTGLVAGTTYYVRAYATNGSGTSYGNQVSFVAVNPPPVFPAGSVFCAAGQTAIVDVTNPSTGKTWMDRNLGASQVATSSTDAAAYGDLYQWGRRSDGHQCRNSATTTTLSSTDQPGNGNFIVAPNTPNDWRSPQNINLWQGLNGVNNPCPSGYRLPTETELDGERLSWSSNNSAGAFGSTLKWSNVGGRLTTGVLNAVGTTARYWSSTIISGASRALAFETTNAYLTGSFARAFGFAIRCIKN
jgi:uncharacterized protein (TIGR02145 family)